MLPFLKHKKRTHERRKRRGGGEREREESSLSPRERGREGERDLRPWIEEQKTT